MIVELEEVHRGFNVGGQLTTFNTHIRPRIDTLKTRERGDFRSRSMKVTSASVISVNIVSDSE